MARTAGAGAEMPVRCAARCADRPSATSATERLRLNSSWKQRSEGGLARMRPSLAGAVTARVRRTGLVAAPVAGRRGAAPLERHTHHPFDDPASRRVDPDHYRHTHPNPAPYSHRALCLDHHRGSRSTRPALGSSPVRLGSASACAPRHVPSHCPSPTRQAPFAVET